MAHNALVQAIEQIGREKGIDHGVIITAVEDAYAAAARKVFKTRENIVSQFDPESGEFKIYAKKKVVPEVEDPDIEISLEEALEIEATADFDMELRFPRDIPQLGRIAAQAAKQVIYQKVKEAEREKVYDEYIDRVGELITGIVKRFERGDLIVDLGSTEGAIPRREQSRSEHYNQGDRVRAIVADVVRSGKGPQVILSRADPRLVMRLFEMEVPEIYDNTVRVISVARDPGERTKIAVQSRDRDVDPVGACVGMKGNRVQSVIRELRGEKIDIVQYHENALDFVREALKPASANRVVLKNEHDREVEVIVADEQLSLAIGKRGQNVRLAGRLVGWRIDIKSETEKRAEVEAAEDAWDRGTALFTRLEIEPPIVESLLDSGFRDLRQLIDADLEDLMLVPGIDVDLALKIHDNAEALEPTVLAEEEEARRLAEELAQAREEAGEQDAVDQLLADAPAESSSAENAEMQLDAALRQSTPSEPQESEAVAEPSIEASPESDSEPQTESAADSAVEPQEAEVSEASSGESDDAELSSKE